MPPNGAMVYYLGDSIARESTVSDAAWTDMLGRKTARAGKVPAFGYTVAGHNQTFGMDEKIVQGLPPTQAGQPKGILLIGVGISRFIGPPTPLAPFRSTRRRPASCPSSARGTSTTTTGARRSRPRASASWCSAGWTAAGPASSATRRPTSPPSTASSRPRRPRACGR